MKLKNNITKKEELEEKINNFEMIEKDKTINE